MKKLIPALTLAVGSAGLALAVSPVEAATADVVATEDTYVTARSSGGNFGDATVLEVGGTEAARSTRSSSSPSRTSMPAPRSTAWCCGSSR
jgi:hypothetical protein